MANRTQEKMYRKSFLILLIFVVGGLAACAQNTDSDSVPKKKKNIFRTLKQALYKDPEENDLIVENDLVKGDALFNRYRNRTIRHIYLDQRPFGISLGDSSKRVNNFFIRLGKKLHRNTREGVIRNNLFFREQDKLNPYLLADNERFLRDLPYLQDAEIVVKAVSKSAVDVYIITKDVFSLGFDGSIANKNRFEMSAIEQNLGGSGNMAEAGFYYDAERARQFGYKASYLQRNIKGSFVNVFGGFNNYRPSVSNGNNEEQIVYAGAEKPLVSTFDKWTYSFLFEYQHNKNNYSPDSLFNADLKYQSHLWEAWGGRLLGIKNPLVEEDDRWRGFIGMRVMQQTFNKVPDKYQNIYYYRYTDLKAALVSLSVFKQTYFRTKYIYGFGRNEDVPEGFDFSIVAGYTSKHNVDRSYFGADFRRSYFSKKNNYFDLTARYGTFLNGNRFEDISALFNLHYITRLRRLSSGWQQRWFYTASVARTFRDYLNDPLFLESEYGIPTLSNGDVEADTRATIKAETIFFNNKWNVTGFKIAPLLGASATLLKPVDKEMLTTDLYSVVSAGVRVRNESLIFGTIEARANFFPRTNNGQSNFGFSVQTNLQFKYNNAYVRKPDFIKMN